MSSGLNRRQKSALIAAGSVCAFGLIGPIAYYITAQANLSNSQANLSNESYSNFQPIQQQPTTADMENVQYPLTAGSPGTSFLCLPIGKKYVEREETPGQNGFTIHTFSSFQSCMIQTSADGAETLSITPQG